MVCRYGRSVYCRRLLAVGTGLIYRLAYSILKEALYIWTLDKVSVSVLIVNAGLR